MRFVISRRTLLGAALAAPAIARAQGVPIRIGTLTPLTGAGGPYGPSMANCAKAVAEQVNAAGGVLGRTVQVVSEDDQTNPEAGLRAARKLIDVDRVAAILGTWASAVTTAVAPLCWESRTFLCTVSGADSITQLPHNGWLIRTQPNTSLQSRKLAELILAQGAKRVFMMAPQTPFTQTSFNQTKAILEAAGGTAELLIYDDKKPSLRTEVDQAMRFRPEAIILGGYTPDTSVLLRDLYRASYRGKLMGYAYAVNQQLVSSLPPEVTEGIFTFAPSPAEGSPAFAAVQRIAGTQTPDPYTCQVYDHINLVLLAIAAAGDASGQAIRDNIRRIAQGGGTAVDNAVDGLRAIAAGQKVDYDGASGPCDFTETGDIQDCKFRYDQVRGGRITLLRIA